MTQEEYELLLKDWADRAKTLMEGNLSGSTHGKGDLKKTLRVKVKENRRTSGHRVGFSFNRYGVFVHYGVGRGWIRQGNTVVRGSRVKKGDKLYKQLQRRGYRAKDIRKCVVYRTGGKGRHPVDWFDSVLQAHIQELADIVAEFYGDDSLMQLDEILSRIMIEKGHSR